MTSLDPIHADALQGHDGLKHGFFTRQGGASAGIYRSLNCGFGSKDDEAAVAENRARVAGYFGIEADYLHTVYQVHGRDVVELTGPWRREQATRADAMVSRTPGVALGVLAADCTPVLLADPQAGVVGAAHAGWRGALAGVTDAVIDAMADLGARRERVRAAIGPCIGKDSYEVGPEFRQEFLAVEAVNKTYFRPAARAGHYFFDLPGYVAARLAAARIGAVERHDINTYANDERCFSYRRSVHRQEADYGRAISVIMVR